VRGTRLAALEFHKSHWSGGGRTEGFFASWCGILGPGRQEAFEMALIGELMKTDLVTASANETVSHAAWSMTKNGVGAVLVLQEGELRGILSERDVVERVVGEGKDPTTTQVGEVATTDIVTVDVDTQLRRCAQILRAEGFRHLPVLRDGRPEGILSSRDFFEYIAEGLERLVEKLRYEGSLAEGEDPYDHMGGSYGR
jgi:CBS domain-containing protein